MSPLSVLEVADGSLHSCFLCGHVGQDLLRRVSAAQELGLRVSLSITKYPRGVFLVSGGLTKDAIGGTRYLCTAHADQLVADHVAEGYEVQSSSDKEGGRRFYRRPE